MPKKLTGSIEIDGFSIEYQWGHNRIDLCTRLGSKAAFLIQPNGLEKTDPKGLAHDVAASAIVQGIMDAELTYVHATAFMVRGDTADKSDSQLYAIPQP